MGLSVRFFHASFADPVVLDVAAAIAPIATCRYRRDGNVQLFFYGGARHHSLQEG